MKLDLNARRADRAARNFDPKLMVLDGREYALVDELPVAVMEYASQMDIPGAIKAMLKNPDDWTTLAATLTLQDLEEIVALYGATLGESLASTNSSLPIGVHSGPTSNGSMPSTWPPSYTVPGP